MSEETANRAPLLVAAGVTALVLVVLLVVGGVVLAQEPVGVLDTVVVDGQQVGGLDREGLEAAVERRAEERLGEPVVAIGDAEEVRTTRGDIGVTVDVEDAIDEAWSYGRRGLIGTVRDRVAAAMGATIEVELVESVDATAARNWARQAAAELSEEPVSADVTFEVTDGAVRVEPVEPAAGEAVDGDALADRLVPELDDPGPVRVDAPADPVEPAAREADLEAILPTAREAVAGPVTLRHPAAGPDVELDPPELAGVLTVRLDESQAEGERLVLDGDADALVETLGDERVAEIETDPVEAEFVLTDQGPEIDGGTAGFAFDPEATADELVGAATSAGREGELAGDLVEPDLTREEAEELQITEEVSSFTTEFACCQPRVENIQRIAEIVNGSLIRPGERFSLNETAGPRTRDRGFVADDVIVDGEFEEQVGGGVSQFATTLFNAAFFSGIEIVEHQPHSYYIDRYPAGREATIYYGSIDVVVENNSPYGILVEARAGDTWVTVTFWSSEWADVESRSSERRNIRPGAVRDGFDITVERIITYPDGSTESEEYVTSYEAED